MKKMFKRLLGLCTAACMVSGMAAVPSYAETVSGNLIIADFSTPEKAEQSQMASINNKAIPSHTLSSFAYENGQTSLRLPLTKKTDFGIDLSGNDLKSYLAQNPNAVIRVRFADDQDGDSFKILWMRNTYVSSSTGTYFVGETLHSTNANQWVTSSYRLDTIINTNGTIAYSDDTFRMDFSFSHGGTGVIGNGTHSLYVDKVWVEPGAEEVSYADAFNTPSQVATLASYETSTNEQNLASAQGQFFKDQSTGRALSFATINSRDYGSWRYVDVVMPAGLNSGNNWIISDNVSPRYSYDNGKYKYLNMWVYSPRVQNAGFAVTYGTQGWSSFRSENSQTKLDWEGWKLVSYEIAPNISGTITRIRFDYGTGADRLWQTTDTTAATGAFVSASDLPVSQSGAEYGFEGAWVSVNRPYGANQVYGFDEISGQDPITPKADDIVIADYSESMAIDGSGVNETILNSHLYDMCARSNIFSKYTLGYTGEKYSWTRSPGAEPNFTLYSGTYTNENPEGTCIENLNENQYFNIWLYNPHVAKDQLGNYSEYTLQIRTYWDPANGKVNNMTAGIPANFEGWKLISIPVGEFYSTWTDGLGLDLTQFKIVSVIINTNVNVNYDSASLAEMSIARDEQTLAQGYIAGNGRLNTWTQSNNFFDVERVWISAEKPSESFTMQAAGAVSGLNAAQEVSIEYQSSDIIGKRNGDIKAVKLNNTTGEYSILSRNSDFTTAWSESGVTFTLTNPEYNTTYELLLPEMYDANGTALSTGRSTSISTQAYGYSDIILSEDGKSAYIKLGGKLPETVANGMIIGAAYKNGVLLYVNTGAYDEQTGMMQTNVNNPDAEGCDLIKYFFLEGLDNISPIIPNKEYIVVE